MLAGVGTGAPPRAPEQERHHWLLGGCALCGVVVATNIAGAEYLCRISESIHIEWTKIRTSNVVQDTINLTYNTIILWLHITINHTYNVIVPKYYVQCKRTKIEISEKWRSKYWRFRPLLNGISSQTVPISEFLQIFTGQNCWGKVFLQCKYLSNVDINYITLIAVKRAIIPFILITLVG